MVSSTFRGYFDRGPATADSRDRLTGIAAEMLEV
jgi:hypothetical protein